MDIFADKSALVIAWLLSVGVKKEHFRINEIHVELGKKVNVGLIHRVIRSLVYNGFVSEQGETTAKKFSFRKQRELLELWASRYSILGNCDVRMYGCALSREELLARLEKNNLKDEVVLALHSAAEAGGYKFSNLKTLELYVENPRLIKRLEKLFQLTAQPAGYSVLIAAPKYKSLVRQSRVSSRGFRYVGDILNYIDLKTFPLRGEEQADALFDRTDGFKLGGS